MSQRLPIVAVVDDDKVFQFTTLRTIQAANLTDQILQFANGEEALQYLRKNACNPDVLPDLVLLDINMPLVDGWMFLDDYDVIKSTLTKEMTIIMLSSSIDPRDISRARSNSNVSDYVTKPITVDKLTSLMRKVPNVV